MKAIAPPVLKSSPLKVITPVVLLLPRLTVVVTPGVVLLTRPTPTSPEMVTPPAPALAFISRDLSALTVPIFPPIVVNPAPVAMSISRAPPVESSFPVILTFPPPPADVSIPRTALLARTSPVIVKTPLSARVISPAKVVVSAVRLTSSPYLYQ